MGRLGLQPDATISAVTASNYNDLRDHHGHDAESFGAPSGARGNEMPADLLELVRAWPSLTAEVRQHILQAAGLDKLNPTT